MAALGINLFMQGIDHPHQGHLENVGGIADRMGDVLDPRRHPIERTMGLDVIQEHALRLEETLQSADLIDDAIGQFFAADLHLAPAEALEIGQGGMRADLDAVPLGALHGLAHVVEVGGMEAAGDIGNRDQRHDRVVIAHLIEAKAFAHVTVDQRHFVTLPRAAFCSSGLAAAHQSAAELVGDRGEDKDRAGHADL